MTCTFRLDVRVSSRSTIHVVGSHLFVQPRRVSDTAIERVIVVSVCCSTGAVRAREPAVRHGVGVLHDVELPRDDRPRRPQLRVVRRARQEVPRRRAALRRLRHDIHTEHRQRWNGFSYQIWSVYLLYDFTWSTLVAWRLCPLVSSPSRFES